MDDRTAAVLDGLRTAISEHENRVANSRSKIRKSDDAFQTQALWETTLKMFKRTLQQIEKSHEVVATSHALLGELEEMEENERRRKRALQPSTEKENVRSLKR